VQCSDLGGDFIDSTACGSGISSALQPAVGCTSYDLTFTPAFFQSSASAQLSINTVFPCATDQFGCDYMATPSAQQPQLPPVQWAREVLVCGSFTLPKGSCGFGYACAPAATGALSEKLCILNTTGDVACPPGPYTEKSVFSAGLTDSRTCSACGCGPGQNFCNGTMRFYEGNDATCSAPIAAISNTGGSCQPNPLSGTPRPLRVKYTTGGPTDAGFFPAYQAQPMGQVTPTQTATLCCAP
jgi:hypothetical protein